MKWLSRHVPTYHTFVTPLCTRCVEKIPSPVQLCCVPVLTSQKGSLIWKPCPVNRIIITVKLSKLTEIVACCSSYIMKEVIRCLNVILNSGERFRCMWYILSIPWSKYKGNESDCITAELVYFVFWWRLNQGILCLSGKRCQINNNVYKKFEYIL